MYEVNSRISCDVRLYSYPSKNPLEVCTKILGTTEFDAISLGH